MGRKSSLRRFGGFFVFKLMNNIRGIYVITDRELRQGRGHVEIARCAVDGGARIVQIRDKYASDRDFYNWALEIREITRRGNVLFVVNDRVDIAVAVEADGINIGQSDMPISAARKVLPESTFIGVSCSNIDEALQAEKDGADYLGFGPVFATATKLDAAPDTGIETLWNVVKAVSVPVVAIGGIGAGNMIDVMKTGVCSVSVVSAVVCADDMLKATAELVTGFTKFGIHNC